MRRLHWIVEVEDAVEGQKQGLLRRYLRESLKIDKYCKHALYKASLLARESQKQWCLKLYSRQLDGFCLDVLPIIQKVKCQETSIYTEYPTIIIPDAEKFSKSFGYKEKLALDPQGMELLRWVTPLKLHSTINPNIISPMENKVSQYKIDVLSFNSYENTRPQFNQIYMPALIESAFNSLLDEALTKTVTFQPISHTKMQNNVKLNEFLDSYCLPLVKRKKKRVVITNFCCWPKGTAIKLQDLQAVIDVLHSKIYDKEFNRLEFYKIDISEQVSTSFPKWAKSRYRTWKLSKLELKQLSWDPYSYIKTNEKLTCILGEDIELKSFQMPPGKYFFQKLMSGSLDLISIETKQFNCLTLTNNNGIAYPATDVEAPQSRCKEDVENTESTIEDISTSLVPQKRSTFIDSDLISIVNLKKKKSREERSANESEILDKTNIELLSLLKNSIEEPKRNLASRGMEQHLFQDKVEVPLNIWANLFQVTLDTFVIANSDNIRENLKTIQFLRNNTRLSVVEKPICKFCDFLLRPWMGVAQIQLGNFFQITQNGQLFYEKKIKTLLMHFTKLVVLVVYPKSLQDTDSDIFWKVQILLQHPQIEVHYTLDEPLSIAQWIVFLSQHNESCIPMEDILSSVTSIEEEILIELGFNLYMTKFLLSRYTLSQLLLAATDPSELAILSTVLTKTQQTILQKLMQLGW